METPHPTTPTTLSAKVVEAVARAICSANEQDASYDDYQNRYGSDCYRLNAYRKQAGAAIAVMEAGDSQETRKWRWRAKQLGKQLGRSGRTIHTLRAEVAYLRSVLTVNPQAHHSNLQRLRDAETRIIELTDQNRDLQAKLNQSLPPIEQSEFPAYLHDTV